MSEPILPYHLGYWDPLEEAKRLQRELNEFLEHVATCIRFDEWMRREGQK